MFFLDILTGYILPIIYSSLVSLVLVLLVLFIFRIKDSNIRILFFFLPLLKPFIIITEKIDPGSQLDTLALRFPDPYNIIRIIRNFERGSLILSDMNYFILLLIIIGITTILIIRWIILYLFYRDLAYEDKVLRKDAPDIYDIIDNYIKKIKIKAPDVSLTSKNYLSPFIIGIKKSTLVLSPKLLEKLSTKEKETLIQHELSHVKRKDNLIGWVAMILRDFLFFNPFAYIAYNLIKTEQEKDSDKLVVKYSCRPKKEVAANVLNIILKMKSISTSKPNPQSAQGFQNNPLSFFNQLRLKNRINSILKTTPEIYSRIFPKILMFVFFLALLVLQLMIVLKINNYYIFLR
jgi:beta-lactamase regulating signal transducer with metallopeptidase domain